MIGIERYIVTISRPLTRIAAMGGGTALLATAIIAVAPLSPANAAPTSQTFQYTGFAQNFPIPSGVQALTASVTGAGGAAGAGSGAGAGAAGGKANALLNVHGLSTLSVYVGGAGSGATGGFNGGGTAGTAGHNAGGGGGGATDIRSSSATSSRLLTAGGGGGGGGTSLSHDGGAGGAGTQSGANGGGGGGSNGGSAGTGGSVSSGTGGTGGPGKSGLFDGGSGGGGGGGLAGGSGGGGGDYSNVGNAGGGGGGGGGSAGGSSLASNVTYGAGASGNGSASLSWIDITNNGLPDGVVGAAYPTTTMTASGGTGSYTWSIVDGTLPAGLSFSGGVLSGTPTAEGNPTLTFKAEDSAGDITTQAFVLEIHAAGTIVTDAPATDVTQTSATANGTVYPNGADVTSVYCMYGTDSGLAGTTTQVTASPSTVASSASQQAVSCAVTNLVPNTTYYYAVFAVRSGTTYNSGAPQSFVTEPKTVQTANIKYAKKIKWKGKSVVLPHTTRTNAGKKVTVTVKKVTMPRGDVLPLYRVIRSGGGKVTVQTFGKKSGWYLKVVYRAPGTATVAPFKSVRVYKVSKHG